MRALLYKDFVATSGRFVILCFTGATLILVGFAVWAGFNSDLEILLGFMASMACFYGIVYLLTMLMTGLFKADSGKNCREYLISMPVDKKEYPASKYVYFLIASYLILSWGIFITMIPAAVIKDQNFVAMSSFTQAMAPSAICVMILLAAISFPLYILYGKKKGDAVVSMIVVLAAIIFFVWLLFGDIRAITNIDFTNLMEKMEENLQKTVLIDTLFPVGTGLVYYLSYRITAALYIRKERELDE